MTDKEVMREAMWLATEEIKQMLVEARRKISHYKAKAINEAAREWLEKNKDRLMKEATEIVEERSKKP